MKIMEAMTNQQNILVSPSLKHWDMKRTGSDMAPLSLLKRLLQGGFYPKNLSKSWALDLCFHQSLIGPIQVFIWISCASSLSPSLFTLGLSLMHTRTNTHAHIQSMLPTHPDTHTHTHTHTVTHTHRLAAAHSITAPSTLQTTSEVVCCSCSRFCRCW